MTNNRIKIMMIYYWLVKNQHQVRESAVGIN